MRRYVPLLVVVFAPLAVFAAMIAADRLFAVPGRGHDYVLRLPMPPVAGQVGLPKVEGPQDASRPLVVIDAGHGGHDPGAGTGAIKEKMLTLRLAAALRDELLRGGGIRVALTRDDDRFLLLEERTGIARRLNADLFLSIHADSTEGAEASGATVYVLSEEGSSETAQRMADRENRADAINGVVLGSRATPSAPSWSTCRSAKPRRNRRNLPGSSCAARKAACRCAIPRCNRPLSLCSNRPTCPRCCSNPAISTMPEIWRA